MQPSMLLDEMQARGLELNDRSYNAVMDACKHGGGGDAAAAECERQAHTSHYQVSSVFI
jgi:hypothetical protein